MDDHPSPPNPSAPGEVDRRGFLGVTSGLAMTGGLVAGYGTLAAWAGKYLFPGGGEANWAFVAQADNVPAGESLAFEMPSGIRVVIARRGESAAAQQLAATDFLALSSTCPHLGCRVHWEPHNKRFFCPCHNGQFDPEGKATGGPPKDAHQELPRYALRVENGLLFIGLPTGSIESSRGKLPTTATGLSGDSTGSTPLAGSPPESREGAA